MRALDSLVATIRRAIGRDRFEAEINEELEFHVDAHTDELVSRGIPRLEALRQARLRFGSREKYRQEGREISRYRMIDELHADLRDAFRGLKRDRSFAVVATSVIASVLAVNMVLFAFLDAYFLRPLPIAGADRHVEVSARDDQRTMLRLCPSPTSSGCSQQSSPRVGYAFTQRRVIVGGKNPSRPYVEVVSPSYFKIMKPRMAAGRTPSAEPTSPVEPVDSPLAQRMETLLDGDPAPLGKTLMVDGTPLTVVGVLEEGAGGLEPITRSSGCWPAPPTSRAPTRRT